MKKKIAIISLFVLFSAVVGLGYLFFQSRRVFFTDSYKAVSGSAAFIVETGDLKSFMNSIASGQGLAGELGNVKELESFNKKLKFLAEQFNKQELRQIANERNVVISFHLDKKNKLKPLLSTTVPETFKKRHLANLLHTAGANKIIETKKGNNAVLKVPYSSEKSTDTIFVSLVSGLALCSSSAEVIDEAISVIKSGDDIKKLDSFSKVFMASGKKENKFFVVFKNIAPIVRSIYSEKGGYIAEKAAKLAEVASGDIIFTDEGLILNGYSETTAGEQSMNRFKSVDSKELATYRILSSSTILFETAIRKRDSVKPKDTEGGLSSFANRISAFLGDEITRAILDIRGKNAAENSILIYSVTDKQQAEQLFMMEFDGKFDRLFFSPDEATRIPVYQIQLTGLVDVVQEGFAPDAQESFIAFYDNYMITGASYSAVSRLLYDNILNKTLSNDLIYREFESAMPSMSGYYFYCAPSKILDYFNNFADSSLMTALRANNSSLNKIQSFGYQLAASNGMIYNNMSISFKDRQREESTTEWETLLDTVAAIKPFFFVNHITGAREIFIQDMKNNVYLINTAGRVLWKAPVRERITGSVYMVDYYRNGKFQVLFSGKDYLHILDRNGNYVERYPVKLRSPSANSLALFDYDNNKNYRLFIAGEDKLIYSYDISGNVVKGWKPFRTATAVTSEINFFRVSGKDYIVATDESSIYFLDRTGNIRLNLKQPATRAKGSALKLNTGKDLSLVCTAPDGTVQHIYFDGNVKKSNFRNFSPNHSFDMFDIDGDGLNEYLFVESGKLYVYNNNGAEMFSRDFESTVLGGPITFTFSSNNKKVGVFDIDKMLIYLIEKNGETTAGFPLKGASMFSIGKLSDRSGWHLIVGGSDRFLYNYEIDID